MKRIVWQRWDKNIVEAKMMSPMRRRRSQEGGGKSRDGIFAYYITTASRSCIFSREDDSRFGITWNGKNIRSSWG